MQTIEMLISPALAEIGYDIVRVKMIGSSRPTLQVMAERVDQKAMTVEDCATISHTVSALLDVEDPVSEPYTLEVSSPGLDRPLTRLRDYERFSGLEAKIEMIYGIDGRRRFRGTLTGCSDDMVTLITKDGTVLLPFQDINKAKLIMTKELLSGCLGQTTEQG